MARNQGFRVRRCGGFFFTRKGGFGGRRDWSRDRAGVGIGASASVGEPEPQGRDLREAQEVGASRGFVDSAERPRSRTAHSKLASSDVREERRRLAARARTARVRTARPEASGQTSARMACLHPPEVAAAG